eukprot:6708486-Pyramimonas_sp.AAC.1
MPGYISGAHTDGDTGALGGAPHGATKRCTGCAKMQNWVSDTHADGGTGAFGGAPHGATKRCTGWVRRREEGEEGHEMLYW